MHQIVDEFHFEFTSVATVLSFQVSYGDGSTQYKLLRASTFLIGNSKFEIQIVQVASRNFILVSFC